MNPRLLLNIDRVALPFYSISRVFGRVFCFGKTSSETSTHFVIKMLGIGSITRIFSTLKREQVDLDRIQFITFSTNKELCRILEIPNVIFIDTGSTINVLKSSWKALHEIRRQNSCQIIDYERASNLLGIFRVLCTVFTSKSTVSFQKISNDKQIANHHAYSLNGRSIHQLIQLSLPYLPKTGQPMKSDQPDNIASSDALEILININASDYLPERRYGLQQFGEVIKKLVETLPEAKISMIGTRNERIYVQSLIDGQLSSDFPVTNCCGDWSLTMLTERLSNCALLITNDSGPMHLAALLGVKTVAIWGPTTPEIFGYINQSSIINVHSGRRCAPCFTHPKSKVALACNGRIDCMKDILPEQIVTAAFQLIETKEVAV